MSKNRWLEIWSLGPVPRLLRQRLAPLRRHSDQAELDVLVRQLARRLASGRKQGEDG